MWHIVLIGYLFVAVMYSAAQPNIARALIYLVFWAVLPVAFTVFHRHHPPPQPPDEATGKGSIRTKPPRSRTRRRQTGWQCIKSLFRRPLIRYNPSVFHFGNTLFFKTYAHFRRRVLDNRRSLSSSMRLNVCS